LDKRKWSREFWAKYGERFAETDRLLKARFDAQEARFRAENPGVEPPKTTEEWYEYVRGKRRDAPAQS
jgi:hypothetical protein